MKKYFINDNWEAEEYDDLSDIFLLVVEQSLPDCCYVHKANFDPAALRTDYNQLVDQYVDTETDGVLRVHIVKVPNTQQVCDQITCADSMDKGSTEDAIAAINNILNRADCEILESWAKDPLTEGKRKRKKRKPYNSITYTTGCPGLNLDFFNSHFGTGNFGDNNCSDSDCIGGDCGGESCSESLTEAQGEIGKIPGKRYIKRYYIRPQNIFCSKKEDILKALVSDVGDANCSVYSLKSLDDHDDVHLLQPSDIIYYYDDGILYDKNHVKVMDYDLNVKHEEERTKFANVDAVSDDKFDAEYEDRLVEEVEKRCCICAEKFEGHGNNPEPVAHEGRCCDACNLKFVVPARIELAFGDKE